MSNEQEPVSLEVLPPSSILAVERAQIDSQIATAHAYPRSLEAFKKRALQMACLDADTAESCIYVRPVGKEKDEKTGKWVEKYAEGPSIRLAEIVSTCYGNIRAAARVVEATPQYVRCEGVCHDLETNVAVKADCTESTVDKNGKPYSARTAVLVSKGCISKALRDSIFRVVPRALCKPIYEAAKKVAASGDRPIAERRKKARAWVASLKIDEARVLAALDITDWEQANNEHLLILTGLKTAMADGDESVDSAFPPIGQQANAHTPAPTAHQQATQAPKTASDASAPPSSQSEPSAGKAPAQPPKAAESAPSASVPASPTPSQTASDDEKAESEAGLAPEQPKVSTSETPQGEVDPHFEDATGDGEAVKSVKLLCRNARITYDAFHAWLLKMKLRKENQKFTDLAEAKLLRVQNSWATILPEIRKEERHEPPTP